MSLGKLVLDLSLNGNQFTVQLKQAEGALGQFVLGAQRASSAVNRAESSTHSWGKSLRDVIVSLALVRDALRTLQQVTVGWQTAIVGANSEMERSIMLMKNFSKETDGVKRTQEAVADVNMLLNRASTSPYNITQITDAFVKLRVGGVEPAEKSLNTLVDSVAAFGGSGENLKRAGVAIQQMAGKGVVSMEELRQQLGEAVPSAIQAMADGLGTTYQKLVKEISQGKVLSQPAIIAMMQQLELQFKGSAAAMMDTWGGAVAQFETTSKRLAMAIGGLETDGYSQDGYLKTLTNELKALNVTLSSPDMLNSAKELGMALASLVKTAADGTQWIIANRQAIFEWGRIALITFAAFKSFSVVGSIMGGVSASINTLSQKMIALTAAGTPMARGFTTWVSSISGWTNATTTAATAATRLATGLPILAGAVHILGGAVGMLLGPLGMVATLLGSAAYAMWQNKRAAEENAAAILKLNGALNSNAQLETLLQVREDKRAAYKKAYGGTFAGYGQATKEEKEAKLKAEQELKDLDDQVLKGRLNVAKVNADTLVNRTVEMNQSAIHDISNRYKIDTAAVRKQFEDEAKKNKKPFDDTGYQNALVQIGTMRIQDEIAVMNKTKEEAQKVIDSLMKPGQTKFVAEAGEKGQEQLEKFIAAKKIVSDMSAGVAELQVQMADLGKTKLADTLIGGPGGTPGKPQFDGMSIFVDGLRKKLATLDAKIEESNPYLAQLEATIESLGGKKLPNFDKVLAEGKRIAVELWEQEKARKAITDAAKIQEDAVKRIDQIQTLANAKLNKAEERNPWEKASADAIRYEEELTDLIEKMELARQKAAEANKGGQGKSLLEKLEADAKRATTEVEQTRIALERLKVSDSGKRMNESAISINDSLLSETDQAKAARDREIGYLDEYFAKHQEYLNKDKDALDSYYAYRSAVEAQYQRQTESGLEEWIRLNKDATEEYKSLWGSAMDRFTDTLVTNLMHGKAEFGDFVEYVIEEFLRIQMAKAMASTVESFSGSGFLSGLMSVGSSIMGAFGGGNGFTPGSAGAVSSSLGASAAGYSSLYGFADGGIMSQWGPLALRKYANGGIADRPQVAIYGEGDKNEAFVPLPDGRTIPVTMTGGGGDTLMPVSISIVVNKDGSEVTSDSDNVKMNELAGKVKVLVKEVLLTETRPGGIIDRRK